MAVYGYARVSTALQANEGESLDVQQRQIEGWCHMHALTLTGMYVERGVSGSVPLGERPEGEKLLQVARKGDTIIASKLDRAFRSALDALQVIEGLKAKGVALVLIDLQGDVTSNGISKLVLTILAAVAEAERDRIRERVSQVKRDQRERGRYLGGKLPFGYRRGDAGDLVEESDEQRVLALIHQLRRDGKPLRAIQQAVAEAGKPLSLGALSKIVKRPAPAVVISDRLRQSILNRHAAGKTVEQIQKALRTTLGEQVPMGEIERVIQEAASA